MLKILQQVTMKISGENHFSAVASVMVLLISGTSIVFAYFYLSVYVYGYDLVTRTAQALTILLTVHAPVLIVSYSWVRRNSGSCSFLMAIGRGIIGLFTGALANAFGAIVLGAPVGIKYLRQTIYWSLLMSLFTAVPATCVFGSSRIDWQKYLAFSKPMEIDEYMVYLPAYGSLIGAWVGAWPMPLDWDMPWQEWPICVTYGAIAGYLVGLLASSVCIFFVGRRNMHAKDD